jgi:hypothetical protein
MLKLLWNHVNNDVKNDVKNDAKNHVKDDIKNDAKNHVKNDVKNDASNHVKNDVKNDATNHVKNDVKTTLKMTLKWRSNWRWIDAINFRRKLHVDTRFVHLKWFVAIIKITINQKLISFPLSPMS